MRRQTFTFSLTPFLLSTSLSAQRIHLFHSKTRGQVSCLKQRGGVRVQTHLLQTRRF
jgi:hypothetical protein